MIKLSKAFCFFALLLSIVSCVASPETPSSSGNIETEGAGSIVSETESAVLSPSSLNTILPEDILEEVSWFPGGGPGGGSSQICNEENTVPFIKYDPSDTELMDQAWMWTCGWQNRQSLKVTVTFPNGIVQEQVIYADENGIAKITVKPNNTDPVGIYEFEVSDGSTILKTNAYFRQPIVPRLHLLAGNILRFDNFPENELVRLFLYECTTEIEDGDCRVWKFIGWQEYKITADGTLEVQVKDIGKIYYVAVMASDIEVQLSELSLPQTIKSKDTKFYDYSFWQESQEYLSCPEDTPVIESDWGVIVNVGEEGVEMYSQPRTSARIIQRLQNETFFHVSGYKPECSDGNIFWYVDVLDSNFDFQQTGYVRLIYSNGSYQFKSIALGTDNDNDCGVMKSYLSVGTLGRVVSSDSSSLRLRNKPGTDQEILELLPEGIPFLTFEGLECVNNIPWWKIYTQTGLEGWVAEYYDNQYLLTPLAAPLCYDAEELSRLSIGDTAEVVTGIGTALRVRSGSHLENSDILFSIPSGSQVEIVEGPVCSWDKVVWWRVVTKFGNTGWVAEYEAGTYYLEKAANP